MMTITPTPEGMIGDAVARVLQSLRTHLLATVVDYDAVRQTCSAQPIARQAVADESGARVAEQLPVLVDVPVCFPRGGGARFTFPIAKGDTVVLMFMEHSIERWFAVGGADVDPLQDHRHDLGDAIALAGVSDSLHPLKNVPADRVSIGYDSGATVDILPTEIRAGGTSPLLTVAEFNAHTHPAPGGATSAPTTPATGTAVLKGG